MQTDKLSLTVSPLPSGLVKVKTGTNTTDSVYEAWYESVYEPTSDKSSNSKSLTSFSTKEE